MGLFSKFKKKLTRGLRKITPKEIAPILPYAAMLVPGMGGVMASTAAKLLVPQLLTAAGSARTSGEINPLNQAMAGIGSLASINAANQAASLASSASGGAPVSGFPYARSAALEGAEAGRQALISQGGNPNIHSLTNTVAPTSYLDKAAAMAGKIPGMESLGTGINQSIPQALGGQGFSLGTNQIAPLSMATGMAFSDQAGRAAREAEEEAAASAAAGADYNASFNDIVNSLYRMSLPENSLYNTGGRVHLREGGGADRQNDARLAGFSGVAAQRQAQKAAQQAALRRAGLANRYNSMGGGHGAERRALLNQAGTGHLSEIRLRGPGIRANVAPTPRSAIPAGPITPAGPTAAEQQAAAAEAAAAAAAEQAAAAQQAANQVPITSPSPNIAADPAAGTPGLITNINPTTPFTQRNPFAGSAPLNYQYIDNVYQPVQQTAANGGRIGAANGLFIDPPMDPDGQEIIRDPSEMGIGSMTLEAIGNLIRGAEFDGEGYIFPRQPNKFRRGIYDALGFDASNYPGFDDLSEILGYNQGGRIGMNMGGGMMDTRAGYNMGGMGSIPQTPNVPQGMQLEGRGGGFIPMGAQEKKDDVPAMLAKNEFVMTADAVRAAGGGSIEKGAQKMYDVMNQLEAQV